MSVYINRGLKEEALRTLANTMQRSTSDKTAEAGVELAEILDKPVAPHECVHSPDVQLDPPEYFEHFMHCLAPTLQQEQLEEWRKAAHRWWEQETREAQRAEARPAVPEFMAIRVDSRDMVVHVVLPGGNILTLAGSEPQPAEVLATVSERDKRLMRTLLLAASDELVGPYDYGYSYGVQQPMPATFPVAPRPVKP